MTEGKVRRRSHPAVPVGLWFLLVFALFASPSDASAQCALCRDAVAASSTETREAMNYAIIGLALTPYGVAAAAAWALSPALRTLVRTRLRRPPASNTGEIP